VILLVSPSGYAALVMQSDGNLVLYTFSMVSNCQKMKDGNTGGGVNANAIYNIGEVGKPRNLSQVAYIRPKCRVTYVSVYEHKI